MAESESSVRQRKPQEKDDASEFTTAKASTKAKLAAGEEKDSVIVDVFRTMTFLFIASCALSYLISSGESFFWGMKNPPNYMRVQWWKQQFTPAVYLTPAELALHDGTDPTKPLYLAINGTIYDVSANTRVYGPDGSYHKFAGADASRAYVTGCFADDRTGDMRGVEEMFLPLDDPETDAHWTPAELAALREQEMADARRQVHDALKHWVDFFAKSKKYHKVGYVKREKGWPETEKRRELCAPAQGGRQKRKVPEQEGSS